MRCTQNFSDVLVLSKDMAELGKAAEGSEGELEGATGVDRGALWYGVSCRSGKARWERRDWQSLEGLSS